MARGAVIFFDCPYIFFDDMDTTEIEECFADIVMEAPHAFSTGSCTYHLYPLCLGKLMLVHRQLRTIEIDEMAVARMPIAEVMKIAVKHRDVCNLIIAYVTAENKAECFDEKRLNDVVSDLSTLTAEDIATLMVCILTIDNTEEVKGHYGIDKESNAMNSVLKVKSRSGSLVFGGKTLLGALIDQACERYGWTVDYTVWGVSYATLRLLMADRVTTIYLTDEERKKVPAAVMQRDEEVIRASKETMAQIKSMSWK